MLGPEDSSNSTKHPTSTATRGPEPAGRGAAHWVRITANADSVVSGQPERWEHLWALLAPIIESWIARYRWFARSGDQAERCHDVLVEVWERLEQDDHRRLRRFFASDKVQALAPPDNEHARAQYFQAWLRTLVRRVMVDHVRRIPEFIRRRAPAPARSRSSSEGHFRSRSAQRWRVLEQLTTGKAAISGGAKRKVLVNELMQTLAGAVSSRERRALSMHRRGVAVEAIAQALRVLDEQEVDKVLERGREHQRYHPAIELWCAGCSDQEIADELGLTSAGHARRVVKAAKAYLRRHFR
ncbi:hypothetical protein [Haliangium sp.]|uniref:hypothetical protein n=1 Tax=Haliangium sp. TaxID=2663208 RepID=UPI003D131C0D